MKLADGVGGVENSEGLNVTPSGSPKCGSLLVMGKEVCVALLKMHPLEVNMFIPSAEIAGQPRIVLTVMLLLSAKDMIHGLPLVHLYGVW